ncbi:MAG: hypothetical protein ACOZNI_01510 [Myxococcota bacterium]
MWWILACATVGTLQTADTVGLGRAQVAVEPSLWSVGYEGLGVTLPSAGLAARYGLSPGFDLGVRIGTSGTELLAKGQIVRGPPFSLALAGSVGGYGFGIGEQEVSFLVSQAGPIAGVWIGEHQLVIGPKVHDWAAFGSLAGVDASGHVLSVGTSVGVAFRVAPRVRVVPEGAWVMPVWAAGETSLTGEGGGTAIGPGGLVSQYGVALLFDVGKAPTRDGNGRSPPRSAARAR